MCSADMDAGGANDCASDGRGGVIPTRAQRAANYVDIAQNDWCSLTQTRLLRGGGCQRVLRLCSVTNGRDQ